MANFSPVVCFVSLLFLVCFSEGFQPTYEDNVADFKLLMDILSKPRELERYYSEDDSGMLVQNYFREEYGELEPGLVMKGFSWKNCGASSDPFQVQELSVYPDPIKVPGNISFAAKVSNKQMLNSPIQVNVVMKKKIVFWITLPCMGGMGSCNYPDLCQILSNTFPGQCPRIFTQRKLPCHCPLKPGQYVFPRTSRYINPKKKIPKFLKRGDYQLTAKMSQKGKSIGCIELKLSLA